MQPIAYSIENHPADSRVDIDESGTVQTLTSRMVTGGGNVPMVMEPASFYPQMKAESQCFRNDGKSNTLVNGTNPGFQNEIVQPVTYQKVTGPLMANSHPGSYTGQDAYSDMLVAGLVAKYVDTTHADDVVRVDDVTAPLQARDYKGGKLVCERYIVRRLTPLECERLQGFPDGWTDIGEWVDSNGKKHKEADSPRYKALGNSIALPPWKWVLKRLCACYERDATMASLFDGIGGFPLIWEQLNGKGSCRWASEIEEFPMAVTKLRFGG